MRRSSDCLCGVFVRIREIHNRNERVREESL